MKKLIPTILTMLALLAAPAWADDGNTENGKFAFGPQGGLTFPDFHVKNSTLSGLYENKNGWVAGLFFEFGLWTITLRPEINYAVKGYTVAGAGEVKNHSVEIPVLLKINPFGKFPFSPFLVLGPQWSRHVKTETTPAPGVTVLNNTVTDWDISGVGGLGFEFDFSEHVGLTLQGRYSYGFRDVDTSTTEVRTRGFYALAGLSFQDAF